MSEKIERKMNIKHKKYWISGLLVIYLLVIVLHWWGGGQTFLVSTLFLLVTILIGLGHRKLGGLSGLLFVAAHMGLEAPHMVEELSHMFTWFALLGAAFHWSLDCFFFYHEWRHDRRRWWLVISALVFVVVAGISYLTHDHSHHGSGIVFETVIAAGIVGCAGFHALAPFLSKRGCKH